MVYRYIYVTDAVSDQTLNGELPLIAAIGSTCRTWDHLMGLLYEAVGRSPYDGSPAPAFMVRHKVARPHGPRWTLGYPEFDLVKLFEECEVITGDRFNEMYEFQGEYTIEPDAILLRIKLFDGPALPMGNMTPYDRCFCIHKEYDRQP